MNILTSSYINNNANNSKEQEILTRGEEPLLEDLEPRANSDYIKASNKDKQDV